MKSCLLFLFAPHSHTFFHSLCSKAKILFKVKQNKKAQSLMWAHASGTTLHLTTKKARRVPSTGTAALYPGGIGYFLRDGGVTPKCQLQWISPQLSPRRAVRLPWHVPGQQQQQQQQQPGFDNQPEQEKPPCESTNTSLSKNFLGQNFPAAAAVFPFLIKHREKMGGEERDGGGGWGWGGRTRDRSFSRPIRENKITPQSNYPD